MAECGGLARRCVALFGVGEMLVRERQREVVRDAPGEVHVALGKTSRLTRNKEQRPEDGTTERNSDTQCGARANLAEQPAANGFGVGGAVGEVTEQRHETHRSEVAIHFFVSSSSFAVRRTGW